ncbi:Dynactin subunit [Dirofilaria immitis]
MGYERNIAELEALRELKIKLVENNSKLQRQLQLKEKELVELSKINKEKLEQLSEFQEQLEMIMIEKEMAEEKAELLQVDIENEKQRVQEQQIELNLLRNEIEKKGSSIPKDDEIQLKLLEYQNTKLREAVLRMRDIIGQLTKDKQDLVQGNETLKNESATLVKICENLKNELQNAERTIVVLKERIEATADYEKTIEILTEKNMDLEMKLSALEDTVEDYETIRSMDEEILETQKEAERELREEFDLANSRIGNLLAQIKIYGEQMDEYEKMVMKFRRKIAELNDEIQGKQDEIIILNEQLKGEAINNTISAQSTKLTTATRTFAEAIEKETYALELKYEVELSKYLTAFLPDNFSKPGGDNDAILLTVRFSRLLAKTAMLTKFLNLKYPSAPGGIRPEHVTKSHKAEQWAYCAKFSFLLSNFSSAVRQCESIVHKCSVERLSRLAPLQNDIAKEEGMIDKYIDLLKSDKLDENTPTNGVNKGINYLESVLSIYFSRECYDAKQLFLDVCVQFLQGLLWVKISAQRIIFTLSHDDKSVSSEYMKSVLVWVEKCEQLCMRLKNRISISENFVFTQDLEIQLANWNISFKNVASIFDSVCSIANIQLSTIIEAESLDENCIKEALWYSVEKIYGALNGVEATEIINGYMETVQTGFTDFIGKFDNKELLDNLKDKTLLSPLMERANARKQDALEAEKLRWNLEKKDNEIMELKKNIRARLDDISNYKLRLEMAENKLELMGKIDETEVKRLHSQNDDLRDQLRKAKIEYEDTLENLQREIDFYEKENYDLQNHARTISKKILLGQLQTVNVATDHPKMQALFLPFQPADSSPPTSQQFDEVAYLKDELKKANLALEWASQHIRQLKASERMQLLDAMKPLMIPSDISGPLTLLSAQNSKKHEHDELCKRAESILTESRFYQIPYVVDISQPKSKQNLEKRKHLGNIAYINQQINDLKIDILRFWNRYRDGEELPSLFQNIGSVSSKNYKKEERTAETHRLKEKSSIPNY